MDAAITLDELDRQIDALRERERELKRKSMTISDQLRSLRSEQLYPLVAMRKQMQGGRKITSAKT